MPFIPMSEAPGWPLSKVWKPAGSPQPDLNTASKAKILFQLGGITWKLSQLRFDKIGSLCKDTPSFEIKDCFSRGHMLHERYSLEMSRRPFVSETEFYDSLLCAFSGQHVLQQRCSPHYIRLYNEVQRDDRPVSKVAKDEKDYFRDNDFRKTIAKLTLVS
ncbi:hypothetical protein ASPWEDRAFT_669919 [Aspergillus wentii DTO 134E9]|uniref:Uncharacterized protein n=1 Tax=Aspergillus wentii DTO 134E9 TaxID=1073089 RepID=A0A1L9RCF8_ASPWE|nr:uncharacterized protein ASPWEDRAFT_669919 [Aspergillus wentii DTO 134E9]KAI9935112.1 hypothetical protein MW887_000733 [Aspergillus wentii]OJJ32553.1 hypothetical protein ASPWEDRAFT_669919 [Aspergillus wentii DTO 134E9]